MKHPMERFFMISLETAEAVVVKSFRFRYGLETEIASLDGHTRAKP